MKTMPEVSNDLETRHPYLSNATKIGSIRVWKGFHKATEVRTKKAKKKDKIVDVNKWIYAHLVHARMNRRMLSAHR